MKNQARSSRFLFFFLGFVPTALFGGPVRAVHSFWPTERPSALQQAHADYLEGEFGRMTGNIRDALMQDPWSADRIENLQALLDAAYLRSPRHVVPLDWSLDPELRFMKVELGRIEVHVDDLQQPHVVYTFGILAGTKSPVTVKQFQIVRFPQEVVLDKGAGKGDWTESRDSHPWFRLGKGGRVPIAPGLYLFKLELEGHKARQGWFVLGRPSSGDFPKLILPSSAAIQLRGGYPTFAWNDFRSKEYKSFEDRKTLISVLKPTEPYGESLWFTIVSAPTAKVVFGEASAYGPRARQGLSPGKYWLHVNSMETRFFGHLLLSRETGVTVPFQIAN